MNKFILKFSGLLALVAITASTHSASVACWPIFHQPKVPDSVRKLRKY